MQSGSLSVRRLNSKLVALEARRVSEGRRGSADEFIAAAENFQLTEPRPSGNDAGSQRRAREPIKRRKMNQPIDPVELFYDFERKPFQPRRVHLVDGEVFDIPLREMVVIGVDYLDIGIQAAGESQGICLTLIKVPFAEIREIDVVNIPHTSS